MSKARFTRHHSDVARELRKRVKEDEVVGAVLTDDKFKSIVARIGDLDELT